MNFVVVSLRDCGKRIIVKSEWIYVEAPDNKQKNKKIKYRPVYYSPDFNAKPNFFLKPGFDKSFNPDQEGLYFALIEASYGK
jgi:hypothetical protein